MANFINYTGLTYDDIKTDIMARLAEDSRFSNFRESALYSVITEIFAATTDFTNYYIERRSEESFLDSAKLRSSIILLSKMLGYVIRRPIPSKANIQIVIKSLPSGTVAGNTIQIDTDTTFTFEGNTFTLLHPLIYTITQEDVNNFQNSSYSKVLNFMASSKQYYGHIFDDSDVLSTSPITLYQCEKRVKTIFGSTNSQMGYRYQKYVIDDPKFSNFYGDEDFGYSYTSESDITSNTTRVAIGLDEASAFCNDMSEFDSKREFWIDRRSFLNNSSVAELSATGAGADVKYCVVRTSMNDSVELLFGDDNVSSVGAKNGNNIYIRYLATEGASVNKVGVIGKTIQCNSSQYGSYGFDTKNVSFYLNSNITGGSDTEDIESIKINAPEIFYSLDRCVTPRDYISYLKTLTLSTKNIQNAIAWGEQEEIRELDQLANIKLFNVVLFSVLSDMYSKINDNTLGEIYTGIDSDDNVLVAPLSATDFDWFKTIVLSDSSTPLKSVQADPAQYSALSTVYNSLYNRSQITVKNVYVSPIIQDFSLEGTIYFNPLSDKETAKKKILDSVYSDLSKNADFNTPIYISKIIDIVENFPEVHHADLYFKPVVSESLETFSVNSSGTEIDPSFTNKAIGYVYDTSWTDKSKYGTREYSDPSVVTSVNIIQNVLQSSIDCSAINEYSESSLKAILCLAPVFEVVSYKSTDDLIRSKLIWPSSNSYDSSTCSIVTNLTSSTDIVSNYYPSERNLYLGIVSCFMNKLKSITNNSDSDGGLSEILRKYDEILSIGKCFCSLKDQIETSLSISTTTECKENIVNSRSEEILDFVSNYLYYFTKILRNTFLYDIREYMIDSTGNISNFSMKNEIARVDLSNLVFQYK